MDMILICLLGILVIISMWKYKELGLYALIVTVLFVILLPFYYIIRALNGKYLYGWKQKLGIFQSPKFDGKVVMFHGVSVGEVIALENLIKKARVEFPNVKIVVTTGTKTGQEIAQKKYKDIADYITYFPFDVPFAVETFLNKIKPDIVLIAETEMWPFFAFMCKQKNIKLYTINGRISDSTYKLYKTFAPFFKYMLSKYTKILTQSEIDNQKFISIGSSPDKTKVMKNLKFDIKAQNADIQIGQDPYRVIIAGSTHKGEDEIVLNVFNEKKSKFDDIKLLLVPRHTTRLPQITPIIEKLGLSYGFRSKNDTFDNYDVIILDTMGELGKMYSICYFAFIGGSFNNTGGHNPLEAIVYKKPVISGPSIHNFKDIYWILSHDSNAAKIVNNEEEFSEYFEKLLVDNDFYNNAAAQSNNIFTSQQGALDIVIDEIKSQL